MLALLVPGLLMGGLTPAGGGGATVGPFKTTQGAGN